MNTFDDFLKGRFEGVSLSKDGRLLLAPKLETVFGSDQPMVWSVAQAGDGTLYLGTGHRGRLYRVDPSGKSEILFSAPEPEVFAVTLDAKGRVYAATSPNGKVYRIENGKAVEWYAPGAGYIWALAVGRDGAIYVGVGPEGNVHRVEESGKGQVWYETGQSHVTSLAVDAQGRLLAGTEPNGILYRIEAKDKAFVLWDAALPEIRAIVPAADGTIYAAAMGGSVAQRSQGAQGAGGAAPQAAPVTAPTVSITVTEEAAQTQGGVPMPKPQTPAAPTATPPPPVAPQVEYAGVEKSALYRIRPDNSVETLWSSKEENAYDIAQTPAGLLIATDSHGRVYRLDSDRKATLVAETREAEALRLFAGRNGMLVATGNLGKLYRLGEPTQSGVFESPVHDATTVARWGKLSWQAQSCNGCEVAFRVRTGNTGRPDKTWSDWSEPLRDPEGSAIASPNARFVQWKAEMKGSAAAGPALDSVRLAYLPQNTAPSVKSVTVSAQTSSAGAAKPATTTAPTTTYSLTITDTGEAGASSFSGTATVPLTRASQEQIVVSWAGEDADGDRLLYTVHFRGESERDWKLLRGNLTETQVTLDAESLADGRYYFKVTASDRGANPADSAREADLVSPPVLVDRTPPTLKATSARAGNAMQVTVEAEDLGSPLKGCEFALNAGPWTAVAPEDGISDSRRERFVIRVEAASAERLLVVRVTDSAGNAGLAKVVIPVSSGAQ
jgi:sugar lactone lactonase YvrE